MRIAWFTPFSPDSAIGALSREIVAELAREVDVTVWTDASSPVLLPTDVPVVRFTRWSLPTEKITDDTVCVFNIGNSAQFHEDIIAVARAVAGVVILHDSTLHHAYLNIHRFDLQDYAGLVETWYGPEVADRLVADVETSPNGYPSQDDTDRYPLLGEAVRAALTVVVHCEAQRERLAGEWGGPVSRLWLPTVDTRVPAAPVRVVPPGERVRMLSLGWVGEPKQIHTVIEALALDPDLARRVEYRIAGPIDLRSHYGRRLTDLIVQNRLEQCVTMTGWVSADELSDTFDWADLHVNLRNPCTEGGSLSLLQQMASARPVLVGDRGIFAEVPGDAAIRAAAFTPQAVGDALRDALAHVEDLPRVGARGRAWAATQTVERYAADIVQVARRAPGERVAAQTASRVNGALDGLGATRGLDVCATAAAQLERFVRPPGDA